MTEVIDAFFKVLPRGRKTGRNWLTFNCPACGDRRNRGGFLETPTGGFRYRCFNGGCEFERVTGWEPGTGFFGRPRRLFTMLGGDLNDIPSEIRNSRGREIIITRKFDNMADFVQYMMSDTAPKREPEIVTDFPEIELPERAQILWDASGHNVEDCQRYVLGRGEFFREHPFLWTPKYPRHVIYPFLHRGKIVGWIARKIDPGKEFAHIKCPNFPQDYMLNQQILYRYPVVLVQEGTFDAIALNSLCTFGNTISRRQVNLLNQAKQNGRRIVLLPDFKLNEWRAYWQVAKDNGWSLSVPEWPGGEGSAPTDYIKDAGDSIKRNGLLYTMEVVMNSITDDYSHAETMLLLHSRGI